MVSKFDAGHGGSIIDNNDNLINDHFTADKTPFPTVTPFPRPKKKKKKTREKGKRMEEKQKPWLFW